MAKIHVRRLIKSLTPAICFGLFFVLLILYIYNTPVPLGRLQRLGWQSFDIVSYEPSSLALPPPNGPPEGNNITQWWDVALEEETKPISLPLDVWSPLLPHHTGLTEIEIKPCLFFPALVTYCDPRTTLEDDALKGPWVRVERDLNAKIGRWYLSIWYRRSRRLDVSLITALLILADDEMDLLPEPKSSWHKAPGSLVDGVPSQKDLYLWYKLRLPLQDVSDDAEIQEAITEIDVLYGENRPLYGFERVDRDVFPGDKARKLDRVSIVYRRGVKPIPKPKPLHFKHDGTFKIMQIADLHYSVSQGSCRDTDLSPCESGDVETDSLLARALDTEKPDFVVFTGDQLNGQSTSWDSRSVLAKFAGMVIDRNISWAAVFGNHDSQQTDMNRGEEMQVLQSLPFSLTRAGPPEVDGVGNYVLKVRSPDPSKVHLLTLYFLDSGAYAKKGLSFWKPAEYDWIKPSQREWFLAESRAIKPIERPFTPDGVSDIGHIWNTSRQVENETKTLEKPNAMVFFHIPLPEAYNDPDPDTEEVSRFSVGQQLDGKGSPLHNSGFFEDAILKAKESAVGPTEVKVIANGHCHVTDRCRRVHGVWMCFGGGGSYSGYGKIGFDRRFRIYMVKSFGEIIETYKRGEHGEIMDHQVLVGPEAPP